MIFFFPLRWWENFSSSFFGPLCVIRHYRSWHSPSQVVARFRPFWYSPWLVFIISFWSNPIGLCSLAYICASIGILRRSTRIGFGSDYFRSIHYPSLCCHRTSFDPPSFICRWLPTPELCYSGSPSWPHWLYAALHRRHKGLDDWQQSKT